RTPRCPHSRPSPRARALDPLYREPVEELCVDVLPTSPAFEHGELLCGRQRREAAAGREARDERRQPRGKLTEQQIVGPDRVARVGIAPARISPRGESAVAVAVPEPGK